MRQPIAGSQDLPGQKIGAARGLFIKTFGCQMNVYDSERMADLLGPLGYELVDTAEVADMVIINTCHIREKAAEKLFSDLGRLRPLKAERGLMIAVTGCVAQAQGREILRRAPHVDLVLGPQSYHRLPEMIARVSRERRRLLATDFAPEPKFDALPAPTGRGPASFLTIQEGCDKFCTFCVVPYTRGAEFSRPVTAVLTEAKGLVNQGVRELTLLGQNVNAYHGEGPSGAVWGLGRLILELAELPGLERLRYTTSHPRDVEEELIRAHREVKQLMPYLHLPVQSGSDRVLAAMNRGHSAREYLALIERFRAARSDMAFSSDFIVGFPGETGAEFEETLALVAEVGFAQAYSFRYSPRPGTPAAAAAAEPGQGPGDLEAGRRLAMLQSLLQEQQRDFNATTVGRIVPVLLEKRGRRPGQLAGRTPHLQAVHLDADERRLGSVAQVEIVSSSLTALCGRLVPDDGCVVRGAAA